jgi:hypothetical protein
VQEDVGKRLELGGAAVDLDTVAGRDEGVQLPRLAIHLDATGLDQLVGAPPRSDSGAGEVGVQAHYGDCFVEPAFEGPPSEAKDKLDPAENA